MSPPTSNQRTVLQDLVNAAAEVYRISERATLPWHTLAAALNDARAVLAQPDETTTERHPFGNGTRESLKKGIELCERDDKGDAATLRELLAWLGPDTRGAVKTTRESSGKIPKEPQ